MKRKRFDYMVAPKSVQFSYNYLPYLQFETGHDPASVNLFTARRPR